MRTNQREIVRVMETVSSLCGADMAAVCARDLLLQWDSGGDALLASSVAAWWRHTREVGACSHTSAFRHGAWVPAIQL
jgi:hypothetical protein